MNLLPLIGRLARSATILDAFRESEMIDPQLE